MEGYILVKAFADAWFWNSETSNTSVYPETQATVDAHGYVVDAYLVSPVRLSKVLYTYSVGSSLLVSDRRVSSKTSELERAAAWVPRFFVHGRYPPKCIFLKDVLLELMDYTSLIELFFIPEMTIDIFKIRELMTSYHQSATSIRRYYERPSYMGLLNVGRKELPHSCFLSWLFDSSSFNQSYPDSPLMHLLDVAVKRANQQDKIGEGKPVSTILSDAIYGRLFSIEHSVCTCEEAIKFDNGDKRRSDIAIRCAIKNNDGKEQKLNVCIENKVLSSEHTSQTKAYSSYYLEKDDAEWLFLFLTPLSSVKLDYYDNLKKEDKCDSNQFIQINYQDLLDYVLEPLINSVDNNSHVHFMLDDYIKTLRYPVMEEKNCKRTIMAIGEQETKLLNDFWEGNHELIELALMAMCRNKNLDEEVRESAENAYHTMQSLQTARKDSTKYVIIYKDHNDNNSGNGYKKVDVAKIFAKVFCNNNPQISDEETANTAIRKEIKTTKKKLFDDSMPKIEKITLNNETSVSLNTNIWGESTDCWLKLRDYLSKENPYFRIEPMK